MPFGMGPAGWFMLPYLYPYWPMWRQPYHPYYETGYYPSQFPFISKEQEIRMLEEEARILEQELDEIRKRIEELRGK